MNILADENVDKDIVLALRAQGHSVVWIVDLTPSISDEEVLDQANRLNAI